MDTSGRSAHGNAYSTGLGRSKLIVLFDTLVAAHSEAELAHELGHFKLKHVGIGLLRTAALLFAACFAAGVLCKQAWLLPSFGIAHRDHALALIVYVLTLKMTNPRRARQLGQPAA
jgi:STE24 endopeptidase